MAAIITAPELGMDYAMYGDNSHMVANYIQQQLQSMPVQGSAPYQNSMVQSLQESYNYVTDTAIRNSVVQSLRSSGVVLDDSFIVELRTFEELQQANFTMQRWVMADSYLRQLMFDQNIAAYGDTYVNISGRATGERDYNYQLVMSGVPVDQGNGTEIIRFYPAEDNLLPGDRVLDHHEKVAIQHTWRNARAIAQELGFDFTNQGEVRTKINFE